LEQVPRTAVFLDTASIELRIEDIEVTDDMIVAHLLDGCADAGLCAGGPWAAGRRARHFWRGQNNEELV